MARVQFRRDSNGIAEVLRSRGVRDAIHGLAERVAGRVRALLPAGTDVVVDDYTTDRAASAVTIRDMSGRLWQARDGVLTRAASAEGLEVRERGS